MTPVAVALAVLAGLAGSIQVAVMGRFGGAVGVWEALAFSTAVQLCFAVAILFDDPDQSKFPIGAQGVAAVYTKGMHGPWAALRRISIRITSWMNWLYPMPF